MRAIRDLPIYLRLRLASALEAGYLVMPYSTAGICAALGGEHGTACVAAALLELGRIGVVGAGAAAWIRSLDGEACHRPPLDLVWSGPEVPGLFARDTRRVFAELFASARRSVWASTYVVFDGPRIFEVLARHMDATPGLAVTLLLNIERKPGDARPADALVQAFARQFWQQVWPGAARHPDVYYDPRPLEPDRPGVLHAKTVIVDDEVAFVTSANLTGRALEHNIELGLLVRDSGLAANVTAHFGTLITRRLLLPLPR
jgi:phosphatidylserine/phosphatidylglycerophosphate/cardiolipin synthase-like enzyme